MDDKTTGRQVSDRLGRGSRSSFLAAASKGGDGVQTVCFDGHQRCARRWQGKSRRERRVAGTTARRSPVGMKRDRIEDAGGPVRWRKAE